MEDPSLTESPEKRCEEYALLEGWKAHDFLIRLMDSTKFLRGAALDSNLGTLGKMIVDRLVPPPQRTAIAVGLYNQGFIECCFELLELVMTDDSCPLAERLEASKFLFSREEEKVGEFLRRVTKDLSLDSSVRLGAMAPFSVGNGIPCRSNFERIKAKVSKEFVASLFVPFFAEEGNGDEERIQAGQVLLGIPEERAKAAALMMEWALGEGQRAANAADVMLRHGTETERTQAREAIARMGRAAYESKRTKIPMSYAEDSQNVHVVEDGILEEILEEKESAPRSFEETTNEVMMVARRRKLNPKSQHAVKGAIHRIEVDTSTFGSKNATLVEYFVKVWAMVCKANERSSLEGRMLEELMEMDDTCSSGRAMRLANVVASITKAKRIGWKEQIASNVKGRIMARMRKDQNQETIALGSMEDAEEGDRKAYLEWVEGELRDLEKELEGEFVGEGHVTKDEFGAIYESVKEDWLGS